MVMIVIKFRSLFLNYEGYPWKIGILIVIKSKVLFQNYYLE